MNSHRIFATILTNCLIYALASNNMGEVAGGWVLNSAFGLNINRLFSWVVAVPCALGSRLLLSMRKQYFKEEAQSQSMSWQAGTETDHGSLSRPTSGISFATASLNVAPVSALSSTNG
jgi:hypothetical protein